MDTGRDVHQPSANDEVLHQATGDNTSTSNQCLSVQVGPSQTTITWHLHELKPQQAEKCVACLLPTADKSMTKFFLLYHHCRLRSTLSVSS